MTGHVLPDAGRARVAMRNQRIGSRRHVACLPWLRTSGRLFPLVLLALACGRQKESQSAPGRSAVIATPGPGAPSATGADMPTTGAADTSVMVNGGVLSAATLQQLHQVYPVAIPAGRYWYDAISGAWGRDGEPIAGQMMPGLRLGGTLAADASRGTSGVFINGRQLTVGEALYIERLCQTPVVQGRYFVMANGIGGYEGAPASFNLGQCPGVPQQGGGARSMSRTYCDPNGACTTSGILGSITTAPM